MASEKGFLPDGIWIKAAEAAETSHPRSPWQSLGDVGAATLPLGAPPPNIFWYKQMPKAATPESEKHFPKSSLITPSAAKKYLLKD